MNPTLKPIAHSSFDGNALRSGTKVAGGFGLGAGAQRDEYGNVKRDDYGNPLPDPFLTGPGASGPDSLFTPLLNGRVGQMAKEFNQVLQREVDPEKFLKSFFKNLPTVAIEDTVKAIGDRYKQLRKDPSRLVPFIDAYKTLQDMGVTKGIADAAGAVQKALSSPDPVRSLAESLNDSDLAKGTQGLIRQLNAMPKDKFSDGVGKQGARLVSDLLLGAAATKAGQALSRGRTTKLPEGRVDLSKYDGGPTIDVTPGGRQSPGGAPGPGFAGTLPGGRPNPGVAGALATPGALPGTAPGKVGGRIPPMLPPSTATAPSRVGSLGASDGGVAPTPPMVRYDPVPKQIAGSVKNLPPEQKAIVQPWLQEQTRGLSPAQANKKLFELAEGGTALSSASRAYASRAVMPNLTVKGVEVTLLKPGEVAGSAADAFRLNKATDAAIKAGGTGDVAVFANINTPTGQVPVRIQGRPEAVEKMLTSPAATKVPAGIDTPRLISADPRVDSLAGRSPAGVYEMNDIAQRKAAGQPVATNPQGDSFQLGQPNTPSADPSRLSPRDQQKLAAGVAGDNVGDNLNGPSNSPQRALGEAPTTYIVDAPDKPARGNKPASVSGKGDITLRSSQAVPLSEIARDPAKLREAMQFLNDGNPQTYTSRGKALDALEGGGTADYLIKNDPRFAGADRAQLKRQLQDDVQVFLIRDPKTDKLKGISTLTKTAPGEYYLGQVAGARGTGSDVLKELLGRGRQMAMNTGEPVRIYAYTANPANVYAPGGRPGLYQQLGAAISDPQKPTDPSRILEGRRPIDIEWHYNPDGSTGRPTPPRDPGGPGSAPNTPGGPTGGGSGPIAPTGQSGGPQASFRPVFPLPDKPQAGGANITFPTPGLSGTSPPNSTTQFPWAGLPPPSRRDGNPITMPSPSSAPGDGIRVSEPVAGAIPGARNLAQDPQDIITQGLSPLDVLEAQKPGAKNPDGSINLADPLLRPRIMDVDFGTLYRGVSWTSYQEGILPLLDTLAHTDFSIKKLLKPGPPMEYGMVGAETWKALLDKDPSLSGRLALPPSTNPSEMGLLFQGHEARISAPQYTQGPKVSALQETLKKLGNPDLAVTGHFDEATARAVEHFQRSNGIKDLGIDRAALKEALGQVLGSRHEGLRNFPLYSISGSMRPQYMAILNAHAESAGGGLREVNGRFQLNTVEVNGQQVMAKPLNVVIGQHQFATPNSRINQGLLGQALSSIPSGIQSKLVKSVIPAGTPIPPELLQTLNAQFADVNAPTSRWRNPGQGPEGTRTVLKAWNTTDATLPRAQRDLFNQFVTKADNERTWDYSYVKPLSLPLNPGVRSAQFALQAVSVPNQSGAVEAKRLMADWKRTIAGADRSTPPDLAQRVTNGLMNRIVNPAIDGSASALRPLIDRLPPRAQQAVNDILASREAFAMQPMVSGLLQDKAVRFGSLDEAGFRPYALPPGVQDRTPGAAILVEGGASPGVKIVPDRVYDLMRAEGDAANTMPKSVYKADNGVLVPANIQTTPASPWSVQADDLTAVSGWAEQQGRPLSTELRDALSQPGTPLTRELRAELMDIVRNSSSNP